jgi:hypothetical protein
VEDQCQGGAPAAKRGRTTLTVIFARREDARREEDGPVGLRRRGSPGTLRPVPPACGAGELTGVRRRARRASARQGAAGRRPTVRRLPIAPPPRQAVNKLSRRPATSARSPWSASATWPPSGKE